MMNTVLIMILLWKGGHLWKHVTSSPVLHHKTVLLNGDILETQEIDPVNKLSQCNTE